MFRLVLRAHYRSVTKKSTILKVSMSFQSLDISTNNLIHVHS